MLRTRLIDERLTEAAAPGPHRLPRRRRGEEAAILASAAAMRDAGLALPLLPRVRARRCGAASRCRRYVDNMFGNANDPVKGRQMPDHYHRASGALRLDQLADRHADHAGRRLRLGRQDQEGRPRRRASTSATARPARNDFHGGHELRRRVQGARRLLLPQQRLGDQRARASGRRRRATFADKGVAYGMPGVRCRRQRRARGRARRARGRRARARAAKGRR